MDNKKERTLSTLVEALMVVICELVISAIVVGVYFLLQSFTYKVVTGALIGTAAVLINYLIMAISINRAIDDFMLARGDREMDEEEAAKFASEHTMAVQNSVKSSYLFRTMLMLAVLVLALVSGWFDPIATVVPLLMFKPIIYFIEFIRKRRDN